MAENNCFGFLANYLIFWPRFRPDSKLEADLRNSGPKLFPQQDMKHPVELNVAYVREIGECITERFVTCWPQPHLLVSKVCLNSNACKSDDDFHRSEDENQHMSKF